MVNPKHHTCHTSSHIPPGAAFVFTGQERRYFGSAQRQRPHERRGGTQEEVELRTGERPPGNGPQPSLAWMFGMFGAWGKPVEAWGGYHGYHRVNWVNQQQMEVTLG